MRFTTDARLREIGIIAPEAQGFEVHDGLVTFRVRDRDAACVVSELRRAGYAVTAGGLRVSYSSPRAYASASSHLRVR